MRFEPAQRHPSAYAAVAFLVVVPTLVFVTLSVLGHELGMTAVADVVDPIVVAVTSSRIVDLGLVVAPVVAAFVALLPLVDLRLEHGGGEPMLALRVRALPRNLAVVGLALVLGAALVAHIVAESVLHAGA